MHSFFPAKPSKTSRLRMLSNAVNLKMEVAITLPPILLQDSFALADALLARSATWVLPPQLCVTLQ